MAQGFSGRPATQSSPHADSSEIQWLPFVEVRTPQSFRVAEIDPQYRFEGEADCLPVGDVHLLTHGRIERQRFVPAFAMPPWRRVDGFRTDVLVKMRLGQVTDRGVEPVVVDVSEFLKKGGGSEKCMIADLGAVGK